MIKIHKDIKEGERTMSYQLPAYTNLTDEQRIVVNLPMDKNHLVTGGPGTGKSIVAIYMAKKAADAAAPAGRKVIILVHNWPLAAFMKSAVKDLGLEVKVDTYHSWMARFFINESEAYPPQHKKAYQYKWDEILPVFRESRVRYDHIIVDEAQDIPTEMVQCLTTIAGGVTCLMDAHQSIFDGPSDWKDVADVLAVRSPYRLKKNFRNPDGIRRFAGIFHSEEEKDAIADDSTKLRIIKCRGYGMRSDMHMTSRMVKVLNDHPEYSTIGVFTNVQNQEVTYNQLKECLKNRDVYMYKAKGKKAGNKEQKSRDFNRPGVYVMTYHTVKGLEFDAVLIPTCEKINKTKDSKHDDNLLYMAFTRVKKQLYLFYIKEESGPRYIDFFGKIDAHRDLLIWEDGTT